MYLLADNVNIFNNQIGGDFMATKISASGSWGGRVCLFVCKTNECDDEDKDEDV